MHIDCPQLRPKTYHREQSSTDVDNIEHFIAEALLLERIGRRIYGSGLAGFPISRQPKAVRNAVFAYITRADLSSLEIELLEDSGARAFWADSTQPKLFLTRSLLAGGILASAFGRKRWRVNYGLNSTRDPLTWLSVPYAAKDLPTPQSEFSYPKVVIFFMSLSYCCNGLVEARKKMLRIQKRRRVSWKTTICYYTARSC